ncbi:sn-glycerol 3-phosphate transport system substrate-binding protein [Arthrobacter stackebrandtii]|uniref:Sn-glycerol 3-phosphate transport system substrate-binding protein n=1 Tax=Arthrobacter stackebrandtii TaxID=272161 RepID=A0ABS4YX45_9MICC|nr:ABC transporter substrate-binding protein [Arthrobacter stackebrandtii]MBP2413343.1 sn-glycerol 3-phosphate transport system substrate-binding protein [Arthrobacter stackebrandtii]PYG99564.1 ABC transporter substrate-binding protein [Arthrobacter stackebrandtii]
MNASPFATMNRRQLLQLAALLGGAGALAACGGPAVGGAGGAASDAATDWAAVTPAQEITWWSNHPGTSKDIESEIIKRFTAETGIKVNLVTAGANYDEVAQKFQAASGSSNVPDLVIASDVWWFRYMINGQILPLDQLAKHLEFGTDDFNTTLYNDYGFADSHWAVPYARSTPLFYYNRAVWEKAGLPDRAPKTWAEFDEWAPKIASAGEVMPLGLGKGTSWTAWWFCNMLWGAGGAYSSDWTMTLDTPEALAAANYLQTIIYDNKTAAVTSNDHVADFGAGLTGCTIASTGSLTGILGAAKFEVGTGFLPEGVKGPACPTGGTGLAIPAGKSPEQQLAAGMFLKFLTNAENTAYFSSNTGYMPVRTSAVEGETMQAVYAKMPQFRTAVDQLAGTRVQDWGRVFVPNGDKDLTTALEKIMLQQGDPAEAFATASASITKSYEENVKPYL